MSTRDKKPAARNIEQYRQIFNEARDGIVLIDLETGLISDCNPEFERQTGRALSEMITLTIREVAAPERRDSCKRLVRDVTDKGLGSAATLLVQPDNSTVDVDVRARKIAIDGRDFMQAIVRDVTQEKAAEAALRESELKYRTLFAQGRDGIVVAGSDGVLRDCNHEFERQTGRDVETLREMHVWDLRPEADRAEARALFSKASVGGMAGPVEQRFQRPDGEIVTVELSSSRITIGGELVLQGTTRDITARKRAQREIHERDERLRLVVEQTPAVLWTTNRELVFTSSEGSGLRALGLTPGQAVGMSLFEFFQNDDPDFLPILVHRQALQGVSASYETELAGATFESHTEPLRNEKGDIIGIIGIAVDVSKRKRAETDLKESEQKLRALALKLQGVREEESASIAREIHDELGQSLTALKMDIGWVLRRISEMNVDLPCGPVLDRLKSMSEDVDTTVKTVRALSTKLRPVILDELGLTRALEWQADEFGRRTGIECDFDIVTEYENLDADRSTAVFRIFQEILTNVARHAEATRVTVKLSRDSNFFVLDVADDGKGIADSDVNSPHALGLLGMRERVQVCGGELLVRRRNGTGTRVVVRIPAQGIGA